MLPHQMALENVNGTSIWGDYKRLQRKRITHSKDMGETVTLQQDITEVLGTTTQSQAKYGTPSISLQPLIRFPSGFLIFDLFLSLILFPISSNFPTAVLPLIWHKDWYCQCNYVSIPCCASSFKFGVKAHYGMVYNISKHHLHHLDHPRGA